MLLRDDDFSVSKFTYIQKLGLEFPYNFDVIAIKNSVHQTITQYATRKFNVSSLGEIVVRIVSTWIDQQRCPSSLEFIPYDLWGLIEVW